MSQTHSTTRNYFIYCLTKENYNACTVRCKKCHKHSLFLYIVSPKRTITQVLPDVIQCHKDSRQHEAISIYCLTKENYNACTVRCNTMLQTSSQRHEVITTDCLTKQNCNACTVDVTTGWPADVGAGVRRVAPVNQQLTDTYAGKGIQTRSH